MELAQKARRVIVMTPLDKSGQPKIVDDASAADGARLCFVIITEFAVFSVKRPVA